MELTLKKKEKLVSIKKYCELKNMPRSTFYYQLNKKLIDPIYIGGKPFMQID